MKKHVHLIGIGGTGLSAIARVLLERGYTVTGSDRDLSPLARQLVDLGVQISLDHRPENIVGADLVVRSSAIPDDNSEVQAAQEKGIPVLKRSEFLDQILEDYRVIAVAGSHGKTTTSAMIAWMLTHIGQDPSFILGGVSRNLDTNARAGSGKHFVIEADEYDYMFLGLHPEFAIVTNVEHDHPDCFPTPQDFYQAFVDFVHLLVPGGALLACGDDPAARGLVKDPLDSGTRSYLYGLQSSPLDYSARELRLAANGCYAFRAYYQDEFLAPVLLQVPGRHNAQNALGALAIAHLMDLTLEEAAQALGAYQGAGRRFELAGEVAGVTVIDDYAHHPTEIRATLSAARARFPERELWAVWQPHTYSRTRLLFNQFSRAFGNADHVLVTEVYPAREPIQSDFSASQVVRAMEHSDARFLPDFERLVSYLVSNLSPGSVVLVLSAGDANKITRQLLSTLQKIEVNHA